MQAWLDQIGLREYASHLNGSGVHGGLLGLHTEVDANQLALILQIPSSATNARLILARELESLVQRYRATAPLAAAALGPAPRVLAMEAAAAAAARSRSSDTDVDGVSGNGHSQNGDAEDDEVAAVISVEKSLPSAAATNVSAAIITQSAVDSQPHLPTSAIVSQLFLNMQSVYTHVLCLCWCCNFKLVGIFSQTFRDLTEGKSGKMRG